MYWNPYDFLFSCFIPCDYAGIKTGSLVPDEFIETSLTSVVEVRINEMVEVVVFVVLKALLFAVPSTKANCGHLRH